MVTYVAIVQKSHSHTLQAGAIGERNHKAVCVYNSRICFRLCLVCGEFVCYSLLRFSNHRTSLPMAAACYVKSVEHLSSLSDKAWIAHVLMILIERDLGDLSADCFLV